MMFETQDGKVTFLEVAGRNFIGLCPWHEEKDPSFTVNTKKGTFYCFGCKKKGRISLSAIEIPGEFSS